MATSLKYKDIAYCYGIWKEYGFWFKREVPGKDGKMFIPLKVRTMDPNIEIGPSDLKYDEFAKIVDDPRVMPFGQFLRNTWFDEIGQFRNIARKEMRLVGIRPRSEEEWKKLFSKEHMERALLRLPGLIGVQYCYDMDMRITNPIRRLEQLESRFLDREDEVGYARARNECCVRFAYNFVRGIRSR